MLKETSIKASIVIPTRNEELSIERCLESIFGQTYRNFEVVVVDSSTDKTPQLAAKYDVILVRQKPKGVAAAFNEGIRHARGGIICLMAADDTIAPDYLEENLKPFLEPGVMGVYLPWKIVKPNTLIGKVFYYYYQIFIVKSKYSSWPLLWRREVFNDVVFDETLTVGEDADFWKRVKKIANNKNWEFRYRSGTYYFSDVDDTLLKNLRKSIWYGLGFVKVCRKDVSHLLKILPIIFFSFSPFVIVMYLLTHNNVYLPWIILYCGSWFFVILKGISKRILTWHLLFIPLLLTWRAVGHLIGIFVSFLGRKD